MRCKACDCVLQEEEIKWDQEHHKWEDLCRKCRSIVFYENQDNDMDILSILPEAINGNSEEDM